MNLADHFRSTQFRIAAAYTCLFAVSVVILLSVVYVLATDELEEQLRGAVQAEADSLLDVWRQGGRSALVEAVGERSRSAWAQRAAYYYLDPNGKQLAGTGAPPPPFSGWREVDLVVPCGSCREEERRDNNHPEPYLALGIALNQSALIVAQKNESPNEMEEVLLGSFGWTMGLTLILAIGGGVFLGHGALRRVDAINRATKEIVAGNLSRRLPVQGARDEVDILAANINRMLDRIGQLMANLQQVTTDIAHDLRTPLGRLRQRLEAAREKDLTVEGHRAALDDAIGETDAILETFAALLRIAQIESKARRSRFTEVDLSQVADTILDAYETVAEDLGQRLAGHVEPNISVRGDPDLLTQLLSNLVENAIRHCPKGSAITVSLDRQDARPVLSVADNGPGIPAELRGKVLDRFYRVEQSRTTQGSGLGLALVKAVADLHDATLELSDNNPGLKVTLRFA